MSNSQPSSDVEQSEYEYDALDIFVIILKYKRQLFIYPTLAAALAYLLSAVLPADYVGVARVTPPLQSTSTANSLLSQVGALVGGIGGAAITGATSSATFGNILESNSVVDAIIGRFDLRQLYNERKLFSFDEQLALVRTREWLREQVRVSVGAVDGVVSIEVYDRDPKRAADMANAFVDELTKVTKRIALSEANQRRRLFEEQTRRTRNELLTAEDDLRKVQQKTGIIQIDGQAQAIIQTIAELRAQIAVQETQIAVMRTTFATPNHPDFIRATQRLASMRVELGKLESTKGTGHGDVFIPSEGLPSAAVEYARHFRAVKLSEAIYLSMAAQLQAAAIDEGRESSVVQVIDTAIPLDKPSKPNRPLIAVAIGLLLGFAMLIWAFAKEFLVRAGNDPIQAKKIAQLKSYLTSL